MEAREGVQETEYVFEKGASNIEDLEGVQEIEY